jgi:6-phosphogluconolactonase (cycloisomerase 2 family)
MQKLGTSRTISPRPLSTAALCLVAVLAFAVAPSVAAAKGKSKKSAQVGTVYTETNGTGSSTNDNAVEVYARYSNGKLKRIQVAAAGGKGGHQPQPGFTTPAPILDTQSEVVLTNDGKWLYAVNAGSDTIAVFKVGKKGTLKRVQDAPAGGKFPSSITVHGHWLYVLTIDSYSIEGFKIGANGKLTAISGQGQVPLKGNSGPGLPRQVGFDNKGKTLVVSLLISPEAAGGMAPPTPNQSIDTFAVHGNGTVGAAQPQNATSVGPFAFTFNLQNYLLMTQIVAPAGAAGDLASYKIGGGSSVSPVDTKSSNSSLPCWVEATGDGKHAYVVNTGGRDLAPGLFMGGVPRVTTYSVSSSGKLKVQGQTAGLNDEVLETDDALSRDSKYLYVVSPLAGNSKTPGNASHIDEYKIGAGGKLKYLGQTPNNGAPGDSGLAAS